MSSSQPTISTQPHPTNPSPDSSTSGVSDITAEVENMNRKLIRGSLSRNNALKNHPLSVLMNNKVGSSYHLPPSTSDSSRRQSTGSLEFPVKNRRVRDSGSFLLFVGFLAFLGYIIWDGLVIKEADINLIIHGHDSYGNICGRKNRPIKFAEKSGQDFSQKQFTKYTLINSQFERYTDWRQPQSGELVYIKEDLLQARARQLMQSKPSTIIKRSLADGTELVPLDYQLLRTNHTMLKSLKSSLMYQYPPMHDYNPMTTIRPAIDRQPTTDRTDPLHQTREDLATSQTENRTIGAVVFPATVLKPEVDTASVVTGNTSSGVVYEDPTGVNEQYEHTLISPRSTNNRANTPDVVTQFEVSNLLYLTECVDSCPADHLELIFYRCLPKNWRFSLFPNAINVTRTFIDNILTDMSHCYREMIYVMSLALVLSIGLLILLRYLASFIIWSCLAMVTGLFVSLASYSWTNYYYLILDLNTLMPQESAYTERLALSDKWLLGSIFLTFVTFAIIGAILFMRSRILLVTLLFREAGKAIADMPLLLLQPVLTFGALISITVCWSLGLICLQSIKNPSIDVHTGFVVFKTETIYKLMKWYHAFGFLWASHFAIACQHYVVGAAVSKWYFSTDRYNLHSPIGSSVSELILYYMGSVALGSFLVAIFKVVRLVARQIQALVQRNCMNSTNSTEARADLTTDMNQLAQPTSVCSSFTYIGRLIIWFFDNVIMVINRDAYVEIAIHGHSFVAAAKQAFTVLASNPLRLLAIKSVSNILLTVAKVCVMFGTVSVVVILLEEKTHQLNYSWSPVVVSALCAYSIAHWFLSVYEMVIGALFICYCEDHQRAKIHGMQSQVLGSGFMNEIVAINTRANSY